MGHIIRQQTGVAHRQVPQSLGAVTGGISHPATTAAVRNNVLQCRHAFKKSRKRKSTTLEPLVSSKMEPRAIDLVDKAKELARELQAPLEEALAMLIDDRIALSVPGDVKVEVIEGALFQFSTIKVYVAAIMELQQGQVLVGSNLHPNPCTDTMAALIAQRKLDRARIRCKSYEDRGAYSYSRGYTYQELKKMQAILLEDQNRLVSSPSFELIVANSFLLKLSNALRHPSRILLCPLQLELPLALSH